MESDGDAPPFWTQPITPPRRRPRTSPLLNPLVLILAIPILILIVLFFLLPPFLSHTNQIIRLNSVKKSWDSLNILLVLFAILCGVFARRNEDAPLSEDHRRSAESVSVAPNVVNRPMQFAPAWGDFPDRKEYNMISSSANSGGGRLRRSSSSYPDLRQETLWDNGRSRPRFLDDFEVNFYRSPPREDFDHRLRRRNGAGRGREAEMIVWEATVDKFEVNSAPPQLTPTKSASPPPPPPPPTTKKRRSVHSIPRKEHRKEGEISENRRLLPPPAPPPPPPRPLPTEPTKMFQFPEVRHERIHRRKSGATKDIATAIASLYKSGQRKRKKKTNSRDIYDSSPQNASPPSTAEARPTPPPPPPPPPPQSNVLQNLFKKSSKSKRVHSVPTTTQAPPPPPPPPNSIFYNLFTTGSRSKKFEKSSTASTPPPPPPPPSILNTILKNDSKLSRRFKNAPLPSPPAPPPAPAVPTRLRGRPPKPTKQIAQYHEETTIAPASPLIPLPPPPPPPPFRMSEFKYVARGDFIRIRSEHSSRCSSPELEDVDVMSVKSDRGDSVGPSSVTCPSPDVNVKADTFIARLRDEWRLEKMNSMKEKQKLR